MATSSISRQRFISVLAALLLLTVLAFLLVRQPQGHNRHAQAPTNTATAHSRANAKVAGKAQYIPALGAFQTPPPLAQPMSALRPEVAEALGLGPAASWERRIDLIRRFPANLTPEETIALLTAMMEPCPPDVSFSTHSTYMHELACILQQHDEIRLLFTQGLASLAADDNRDDVTRDYSVQHLRQVWSRAANDTALRTSLEETLRDFTGLDSIIATPSLLALHMLGTELGADPGYIGSPESPSPVQTTVGGTPPAYHLPDSALGPLIKPIMAGKTTRENMPARMTALRIVGERKMADFRGDLLTILKNSGEHALVRMAAAHAVGKIANPEDLAALASIDPGDARVATALRHALNPKPAN